MYDAIVIGARCAGAPTAMLLGRKGYRVLLVDRGSFPSDTISTHYIHVAGVARLNQWGILDRIIATNCPPIADALLDFGEIKLSGTAPPMADVAVGYAPRRTVLDKILVDAAVESGVEFRENFTVEELTSDGSRITGIKGKMKSGSSVVEPARLVIGADGKDSMVARTVKAPVYNATDPQCAVYYEYWSGLDILNVQIYIRDGWAIILFPTNDGLTTVVQCWTSEAFPNYRNDAEGTFMKCLDLCPEISNKIRQGARESRIAGIVETPSFFRKPFGAGWALAGDAGYYKNPLSAQGITDGFRDADLLADAVDAALSGRQPIDDALAEYEQTRNQAVMPMYQYTNDRATLKPPPPEFVQLLMALPGNQEAIDRFIGLDAGTVSVAEFFSPESIQKIMQSAR
jgi:flavin-dependent dehydrogenase